MKKIIISSLLASMLGLCIPAQAQHFRHGHWQRGHNGVWYWVPALIIGGVAGAVIARESQTPVIIEREPVVVPPNTVCTEWKEIQLSDGKIYRERSCKSQ